VALNIITIDEDPGKLLSQPCKTVPLDKIKDYSDLAHDMLDMAKSIGALGLAANQVGVNRRLFVLTNGSIIVFNPEIIAKSNFITSREEGCLSVPDKRFDIRRAKTIVIRGYDVEGNEFTLKPKKKMDAIAIQHEIDHLNGFTLNDLGKQVS